VNLTITFLIEVAMNIYVRFIDGKWYGKKVKVDQDSVSIVSGYDAMDKLFHQEAGYLPSVVVLFKRTDIRNSQLTTADSSMSVSVFASDSFKWYYVDKDYLLELLK